MDEPALVRRLTTIISVDVVGFSTMSARNEEHALDLLGVRMATAEAIVKHHRGRVFKLTGDDGPNWLNDPTLALSLSMVVHIWKSLPFWTLILLAGRLAIPGELYEAASVDGAGAWHRFRFITWPSISTLYVTCTFLSMIFTVGDFNSVYLLTGGGPADLTHVLATLGIRYLRLDQVGLAMASIVCALPLILPLVFVMMKRLSK